MVRHLDLESITHGMYTKSVFRKEKKKSQTEAKVAHFRRTEFGSPQKRNLRNSNSITTVRHLTQYY